MVDRYHYVRFRWWKSIDLKKISEDFGDLFHVEMLVRPSAEWEISLYKDERDELKVSADTLVVIMSRFKAVLYQKEVANFTKKDIKLRKKILKLYPHNRATPAPLMFSREPKFEEEQQNLSDDIS